MKTVAVLGRCFKSEALEKERDWPIVVDCAAVGAPVDAFAVEGLTSLPEMRNPRLRT